MNKYLYVRGEPVVIAYGPYQGRTGYFAEFLGTQQKRAIIWVREFDIHGKTGYKVSGLFVYVSDIKPYNPTSEAIELLANGPKVSVPDDVSIH